MRLECFNRPGGGGSAGRGGSEVEPLGLKKSVMLRLPFFMLGSGLWDPVAFTESKKKS